MAAHDPDTDGGPAGGAAVEDADTPSQDGAPTLTSPTDTPTDTPTATTPPTPKHSSRTGPVSPPAPDSTPLVAETPAARTPPPPDAPAKQPAPTPVLAPTPGEATPLAGLRAAPELAEFDPFSTPAPVPKAKRPVVTTNVVSADQPASSTSLQAQNTPHDVGPAAEEPTFNFAGFLRDLRSKPADPVARYLKRWGGEVSLTAAS